MTLAPFYLTVHRPYWLPVAGVPLFVSHSTLKTRKKIDGYRALAPWGLDSGGFTQLDLHHEWTEDAQTYVRAARRYNDEIGMLDFISPQDWMCEEKMLAKTGKTVAEHQRLTVDNFLELRTLDAELPIIPVLQGFEADDYLRCVDLYERAGIDLTAERLVGVGTVCRRQDTASGRAVLEGLAPLDLSLHGYGVKITGLKAFGHLLTSSDSMSWSLDARHDAVRSRGRETTDGSCGKKSCANCLHYALQWRRERVMPVVERTHRR